MRAIIEPQGPPEPGDPGSPLWRRLGWFFALAFAALTVCAAAAYGLKALLPTG